MADMMPRDDVARAHDDHVVHTPFTQPISGFVTVSVASTRQLASASAIFRCTMPAMSMPHTRVTPFVSTSNDAE